MHLGPVKPQLAGVQTGEGRKVLLRSMREHQSILGQQEPLCTGHLVLSQWTPTTG